MTVFIKTERLILKPTKQSDFDDLFALRSDPDVMKYTEQGVQTKKDVQKFLDITVPYQKKYGHDICSVFEKNSGTFVGQAGLFRTSNIDEQSDIEIGFSLHKKYWDKGYGTELVTALIQWGFEHLSVTKLIAFTNPENAASHRVLQKCGMINVGIEHGSLTKYEIYKNDSIKQSPMIVFLTGASGAGKTTILDLFNRKFSTTSITCLHFDSIGVTSEEEMIKIYGSGSEWQKAMTYRWIKKLISDYQDTKLVILEGQVNLDFIVSAFEEFHFNQYKIVLAHCENTIRHKRLHQDRNQSELINDTMDNWADFLKKQAIDRNAVILDTTLMNADEMVNQFETLIDVKRFI